MNRVFPWVLVALLSAGVGVMFLRSAWVGEAVELASEDLRTPIVLTEHERLLALEEMRMFLSASQQILQAASHDDMQTVAEVAAKVGECIPTSLPGDLLSKLPEDFGKLGFATHDAFDALAWKVKGGVSSQEVVEDLSTLMQNCVACHASWRFEVVK
jgi:hypothetical protein